MQCAELLPNINKDLRAWATGSLRTPTRNILCAYSQLEGHDKLEMNATKPICAVLNYILQKKINKA